MLFSCRCFYILAAQNAAIWLYYRWQSSGLPSCRCLGTYGMKQNGTSFELHRINNPPSANPHLDIFSLLGWPESVVYLRTSRSAPVILIQTVGTTKGSGKTRFPSTFCTSFEMGPRSMNRHISQNSHGSSVSVTVFWALKYLFFLWDVVTEWNWLHPHGTASKITI